MRPRGLVVLVLLVAVAAGVAAACGSSAPPAASAPPPGLRAGEAWIVRVTPARGRTSSFEIRSGATTRTFPLRRGERASTARVVFPAAGAWVYGLREGRRFTRLGRATVRPRRLLLAEPFDVVEADGAIL